jgi:hypothetical protein
MLVMIPSVISSALRVFTHASYAVDYGESDG